MFELIKKMDLQELISVSGVISFFRSSLEISLLVFLMVMSNSFWMPIIIIPFIMICIAIENNKKIVGTSSKTDQFFLQMLSIITIFMYWTSMFLMKSSTPYNYLNTLLVITCFVSFAKYIFIQIMSTKIIKSIKNIGEIKEKSKYIKVESIIELSDETDKLKSIAIKTFVFGVLPSIFEFVIIVLVVFNIVLYYNAPVVFWVYSIFSLILVSICFKLEKNIKNEIITKIMIK